LKKKETIIQHLKKLTIERKIFEKLQKKNCNGHEVFFV